LQELLELVAGVKYAAPMAARLGWDGGGGRTLEEAGALLGVSRERIRQVEKRTLDRIPKTAFLPSLDKALNVLDAAASSFHPDASTLLTENEVTAGVFQPYGVITAARLLGREAAMSVTPDGRSVQRLGDQHFGAIRDAFRSVADVNYVASVAELQARIDEDGFTGVGRDTTYHLLERHPNTVWLDAGREWFWLRQADGRNRYINAAKKILSVSGAVRLETLREGVLRHHRSKGLSLPRHVFEGLCRAAGFTVRADMVSACDLPHPYKILTPIERVLFDVLRANENVAALHRLRDLCVAAGVNRHSFYVYLTYSPILARFAPSIWGLRGAQVDPTHVARLLAKMPVSRRALQDHGWTPDGAVWIAYEVSRGLFDSGVVTVPAAVRDVIGETKFELYAVDGARVGTLNVRKLSMWGFSGFIARRGIEIGDYLVFAIDAELQMCVVHAGSSEVVETFTDDSGWGPRRLIADGSASRVDPDE
jgi:hypothetical protein